MSIPLSAATLLLECKEEGLFLSRPDLFHRVPNSPLTKSSLDEVGMV